MNIFVEGLWAVLEINFEILMSIIRWFLPTKHKSIKGEICLVTGAGNGIGRLMALEFAKRGAIVVLWDIDENGNKATAEKVRKLGWKAFSYKCDVSNRKEVYEVARQVKDEVGDVSILVNNAGIVYGKGLLNSTDDEMERTMKVNVLSQFWTVRAFLPHMLEENHGHIVNLASAAGLFAIPGFPAYIASKHAVVGFSRALETDLAVLGKDGIKTTVVCPYHITTGMFNGLNVRFPKLTPSLTPDECVTAIMHAVLTDRKMVAIPRALYLGYNMITWVPEKAMFIGNKFFGGHGTKNTFVPTRSYQKEAYKMSL